MFIKKNMPRTIAVWTSASIVVAGLHFGAFYLVTKMQGDINALRGAGPEAIMLEFAEEPTAPYVEEISENIQQKTIAEAPEKIQEDPPKEKSEPEPEPILQQSEMAEEIKVPEKEKKEEDKPKEEIKKTQPEKEQKKQEPKEEIVKAKKEQKSKGPQIIAKKANNFAAPVTNRNAGKTNGRLIASWQNKVQKHIANISKRYDRPSKKRNKKKTFITFSFDDNGVIQKAIVSISSRDQELDDWALKIVIRSSPIPEPPKDLQVKTLTIPVTLD